jgi:NAD(P)-dependent dehydrogenase (short-subunit alcohol dehydrogenase family)
MDIDLTDKVVVVTGAGRGLGRALALGLAEQGARIAVLTRRHEQAQAVVAEIDELPGAPRALAVEADVADEAAVIQATTDIDNAWGRIDALINNAAWIPPRQHILNVQASLLERVLRSNVIGNFLMTKHVAPIMIREGGGRIIYLSSTLGVQANPGLAPYGASKAAINILANVAHQELASSGIRTVALAPGLTDTPGMRNSVSNDYIEHISQTYPGRRLAQPQDIVPLTAFLCSPAANELSGTVISVRPPATG